MQSLGNKKIESVRVVQRGRRSTCQRTRHDYGAGSCAGSAAGEETAAGSETGAGVGPGSEGIGVEGVDAELAAGVGIVARAAAGFATDVGV
ncbi:MAG: hypothetical protein B7Z82_04965, partial [Halothiobacillus sp. 20-54-6]